MGLLQKLGNEQGYLKAGFLGFAKSGKTYTAAKLAMGVKQFFNHPGPIAMFDTEGGADYISNMVKEGTGVDLMGVKSRAFTDLLETAHECVKENVSVLLVDSISHVWRELGDAFLDNVNTQRKKRGLSKRYKLEFQDWGPLKAEWGKWTDFYLTSPLHIIICGRAGYEYDYEENEETGKKELRKTGTKMKVESEFGFEPSLLVEMERVRKPESVFYAHRATIIGDRFSVIDGQVGDDPSFDFFKPHIEMLISGKHNPINTNRKSSVDYDDEGDGWHKEKRLRTILCEEIQGLLMKHYPGQAAVEKKAKTDLIDEAFGTRSWTKIENTESKTLRSGLDFLFKKLEGEPAQPEQPVTAEGVAEIVMASAAQLTKIHAIATQKNYDYHEYIQDKFGATSSKELTKKDASELIEYIESI